MPNKQALSQQLAAFAAKTDHAQVPEAVRTRAKLLMLDAVGNAFASTPYEFAQKALAGLQSLGSGESQVIGLPARLAARDAVVMNGILVHGLDFDDTYLPGSMHLTASSVPTALALADQTKVSGKALLTALLLGLEVGARLSGAARGGFVKSGFHATGVCGAFATSIVAGRLLQLNEAQLVMAQGIALSTASSNLQPMQDGSWTKRFHPGWSAAGGITAAAMAKAGYVGPTEAYEGRFGLYPCFLGQHAAGADLSFAGSELGERWEFPRTSVKLYPACHQMHAFMNAAVGLARKHTIDPAQVESVLALVAEPSIQLVCEPVAAKLKPASSYAAQFSLQYGIACSLLRKRFGLEEIEEASYTDPALLALSQKVSYEIDPNSGFPRFRSGEVRVKLKNGETLTQRENILPDEPAPAEAIVEKFLQNTRRMLSAERAKGIMELILNIESLDDVRTLTRALGGSEEVQRRLKAQAV
jgi:2-methylcitrate dehydratase PrpD